MNKQYGNALLLILIAVALFAALSYAITSSSRGGDNIDKEQANLIASQLLQQGASYRNAAQRMMLINGCGESEIGFENTDYPRQPTANPRMPDDSCNMFHADGGGLTPYTPNTDWLLDASGYTANSFIDLHGHSGFHGIRNIIPSKTGASEMVWAVPWLNDEICAAINTQMDITGNTSHGYWMSEYLGHVDFRNNDATNQKPYAISCSNETVSGNPNVRPYNTLHYTLLDR